MVNKLQNDIKLKDKEFNQLILNHSQINNNQSNIDKIQYVSHIHIPYILHSHNIILIFSGL